MMQQPAAAVSIATVWPVGYAMGWGGTATMAACLRISRYRSIDTVPWLTTFGGDILLEISGLVCRCSRRSVSRTASMRVWKSRPRSTPMATMSPSGECSQGRSVSCSRKARKKSALWVGGANTFVDRHSGTVMQHIAHRSVQAARGWGAVLRCLCRTHQGGQLRRVHRLPAPL